VIFSSAFAFACFKQGVLVIGNIPFALVGGIAALWIRGMNLNLSASVGFIALFGVAMLNGVVLVSSINQAREGGVSTYDAVLAGARRRLRPVLMTACVASFGFFRWPSPPRLAQRCSAPWLPSSLEA
jgi:cobalt-zinc-cadmium resistance protein CzcA